MLVVYCLFMILFSWLDYKKEVKQAIADCAPQKEIPGTATPFTGCPSCIPAPTGTEFDLPSFERVKDYTPLDQRYEFGEEENELPPGANRAEEL